MPSYPAVIQIDRLGFKYGGATPIFDGFDWHVGHREAWSIVGPSGCGKSTLLYLLAGLLKPVSGTVSVNGIFLQRPRPETGLILQDHGLLPWATVRENIDLGLRIRAFYGPDGKHAPREARSAIAETRGAEHWMARLGIMDLADKFPSQISGGQRQRTAIARTLVMNPDLLLMDEPFSALDALTREDLQNVVRLLLAETGLATVLVTHSIDEALVLGTRILILGMPPNNRGVIVENPDAMQPGFRNSARYHQLSQTIRHLMGFTP